MSDTLNYVCYFSINQARIDGKLWSLDIQRDGEYAYRLNIIE